MDTLNIILIILIIQKHVFCMSVITTRANEELESLVPTDCSTPTGETGFCVPVKSCFSLIANHNLSSIHIEKWKCGPENENKKNPKVCCSQDLLGQETTTSKLATSTAPVPSFLSSSSAPNFEKPIRSTTLPTTLKPKTTTSKNKINSDNCGFQNVTFPSRILGGETSNPGEFPWLGRLMRRTDEGEQIFSCTGSLIGPKVVLTSAHCLVSRSIMAIGSLYSVTLGEFETDCHPKCSDKKKSIMISNYVVHPDYNTQSRNHDNDIGIIFLKEEVEFNSDISPICILEQYMETEQYYIGGWGKTEKHTVSPVKLKIALVPFTWEQCVAKFKTININVTPRQICAGGVKNRDSCQGDSGGPLMVLRNETKWFVAGLVSFGVGCGQDGWPGVYVHVPNYVAWIKSVIEQNV